MSREEVAMSREEVAISRTGRQRAVHGQHVLPYEQWRNQLTGCKDGSRMVRGWFEDGSRMVRGWFEDGSRMVRGWFRG
jgi:hypothetical protein